MLECGQLLRIEIEFLSISGKCARDLGKLDNAGGVGRRKLRNRTVDFFQFALEVNDLVLLCTDGLWHMVRDERMEELIAQDHDGDPQKLARTLVDEANLAGGEGNVSAIVVGVM